MSDEPTNYPDYLKEKAKASIEYHQAKASVEYHPLIASEVLDKISQEISIVMAKYTTQALSMGVKFKVKATIGVSKIAGDYANETALWEKEGYYNK